MDRSPGPDDPPPGRGDGAARTCDGSAHPSVSRAAVGEGGSMSRRHGRRGRRPPGFTGPGLRELYNVVLPFGGADKRRFFNEISDQIVVMLGVAAAVVGYGAGGVLGAVIGLGLGLVGAARAMVRGRFRRG